MKMKRDQLVEYQYAVSIKQNDLFDAVTNKDLARVMKTVEMGADVSDKDSRGIWPLIMATNLDTFDYDTFTFLAQRTNPRLETNSGRSAIQYAIHIGNQRAYDILRRYGHSVEKTWMEKTPQGVVPQGPIYEHVPSAWRRIGERDQKAPEQESLKKVLESLERATRMADITDLERNAQDLIKKIHVLGLSPDGFQNVAWLQWTRNPSVLTALRRHDAALDRVWYNGYNALGRAVCENDLGRAKYLIELGAAEAVRAKNTRISPEMQQLLDQQMIRY